jgi:hypothetical protein
VLSCRWPEWDFLEAELTASLGPISYRSGPIPFVETSYYDQELGTPLTREIFGFSRLIEQDALPDIKLWTNSLEQERTVRGRRLYNLDPGLLTYERLVLATGKNFTHRIYLGKSIWADLTLIYQRGKWRILPWTFPDYAGAIVQRHLEQIRHLYAETMQVQRSSS